MTQNYSTCKGCGANVLWLKTTAGKWMICNRPLISFEPGGGPETFVQPDGKVVRGRRKENGSAAGYIAHWATCPQRKDFKKEKTDAGKTRNAV